MRRLFAILLFAAFLLPSGLPAVALGQDGGTGLPACCRRDGAHHCAMSMAERIQMSKNTPAAAQAPRWQAPLGCCPYCPAAVPALHVHTFLPVTGQPYAATFFSRPMGLAQTESRRRIARDRSRQKRGPPSLSLA